MKHILMIATGGTIASKPTENGLLPELNVEEILSFVPEVKNICTVSAVQLFNIDSTNVKAEHWLKIKDCIKENYDKYDGFVITHGTDTMAYTSAALSYLIQDSIKPIVLTGSQQSVYMRDSDARANLIGAFIYASDDNAKRVKVVFDGKIILGTRARKLRTKSFNAFSSIDYPEEGIIRDGKVRYYIKDKVYGNVKFYDKLNTKVFVLKLFPGLDEGVFEYIKDKYDAVIIEGFGVGGMPNYQGYEFENAVNDLIKQNKLVILTTQVAYEGSDLNVYEVGKRFKRLGVIEAREMTIESMIAKTMWALAEGGTMQEIKDRFLFSIQRDILK